MSVLCCILYAYYVVYYLYVRFESSRLINTVVEGRAGLSSVDYMQLFCFCSDEFPIPLGTWERLGYFIEGLPESSFLILFNAITCFDILFSGAGCSIEHSLMTKMLLTEIGVTQLTSTYEPRHEKTNVLVSYLIRHKPGCTASEDG